MIGGYFIFPLSYSPFFSFPHHYLPLLSLHSLPFVSPLLFPFTRSRTQDFTLSFDPSPPSLGLHVPTRLKKQHALTLNGPTLNSCFQHVWYTFTGGQMGGESSEKKFQSCYHLSWLPLLHLSKCKTCYSYRSELFLCDLYSHFMLFETRCIHFWNKIKLRTTDEKAGCSIV